MRKLRVFIASSQESLLKARYIAEKLSAHFEIYPWYHDDIFKLSRTPIESLEKLRKDFDAMVVVSTFEDRTIKRGEEFNSIRDNLIFEHALGIGYFGRENSILVIPDYVKNTTGPTDLSGVTHLHFSENKEEYNSLEKITQKLIAHLIENNTIEYPESGLFGMNILSHSKMIKEYSKGIFSFRAIVPKSRRLKLQLSIDTSVQWAMDFQHVTQFLIGEPINNSRLIENKPYDGKEYDALFRILGGSGVIKIEFYENKKIIHTQLIKVLN